MLLSLTDFFKRCVRAEIHQKCQKEAKKKKEKKKLSFLAESCWHFTFPDTVIFICSCLSPMLLICKIKRVVKMINRVFAFFLLFILARKHEQRGVIVLDDSDEAFVKMWVVMRGKRVQLLHAWKAAATLVSFWTDMSCILSHTLKKSNSRILLLNPWWLRGHLFPESQTRGRTAAISIDGSCLSLWYFCNLKPSVIMADC